MREHDPKWVPSACTLPTEQQPTRRAEFDTLFAEALLSVERRSGTGLRLTLHGGEDRASAVADLTTRESECCAFFRFGIEASADRVVLDVGVPEQHVAVLDALAQRAFDQLPGDRRPALP